MRRFQHRFAKKMVAFLAGAALFSSSFAWAEDIQLFNGKDFSNWHGRTTIDPKVYATKSDAEKAKWNDEIKTHWKIEGNEIVNDGKGAYLTTNEDYEDFDFEFEYRIVANCDSGIYLRGIPQVQIWDPTSEASKVHGAEKGSGGLWNNPAGWAGKDPIVRADKPAGEWNKMKIRLVGERCTVWLNDQTVVKHARLHNYFAKGEPLPKSGPIQLQTHGAEIRFRNLKLSTHDAETANKLLAQDEVAAMDNAKFESLFNGKDLAGWAGATSNYTVVDGAIQCMKGKGGVLHSEKVYSDYVFRVDFKLPPAGNNGLAMRYPTKEERAEKYKGNADGAYIGMCELQVLDDGHQNYKSIDPRQAHGSAYGMVAAKRGYLRPTGQWNHQTVRVQVSKVTVELNGTTILDTDLSQVSEFMANTPHPGKDRTSGHVGFAGHSDEIQFKNVEILPLK
jgi:hypothetical protein